MKRNNPAALYVIGLVEHPEYIKIGIATDISFRLLELQTASPFMLQVLASKSFRSKREARNFEKSLHAHFNECRASGEWFRLSAESIANLTRSLQSEDA